MAHVWAGKYVLGEAGVPHLSRPLRESLPSTAFVHTAGKAEALWGAPRQKG
jgi:hypothetical protein